MKRHPLIVFWVLGFLLSWAAWIPLNLAVVGRIELPVSYRQAQTFGAYGPALAALLVTLMLGGAGGLRALFSKFFVWRVGWKWYAVALLLPAGISVLITALNLMAGGELPDYGHPAITRVQLPALYAEWSPWLLVLVVFGQNLLFGTSIGEEMAWRGFALERMQRRTGALGASVLLGLLWVAWGLPLRWIDVWQEVRWQFIGVQVLGAIPAAILITWIFNNTKGSLLLVLLFNTATKVTDLFIAPSTGSPLMPAVAYWLVAICILTVGGRGVLEPKGAESGETQGEGSAAGAMT